MSIPPLVCSTPPPLEQCEDDKDPEEFDLQYNLSQEDYEDSYDYGNFSTYNHFQATTSKTEKSHASTSAKIIENVNESVIEVKKTETIGTNIIQESKFEEDINIEDLNLKVDEDTLDKPDNKDSSLEDTIVKPDYKDSRLQDTINIPDDKDGSSKDSLENPDDKDSSLQDNIHKPADKDQFLEDEISNHELASSVKEIHISENTKVIKQEELNHCTLLSKEFIVESASLDHIEEPPIHLDEKFNAKPDDLKVVISENIVSEEPHDFRVEISKSISSDISPLSAIKQNTIRQPSEEYLDKATVDFDDFQFASDDNKPSAIIDNCDNPWNGKESESNDFGNFEANFNGNDFNLLSQSEMKSESFGDSQSANHTDRNEPDEDFGDFDDFKSCGTESVENVVTEESISSRQVPVLNLQSPDNESQVIESINKVLSTLFEDEIPEPENEFEGKLDSMLGETWGHLLETDVRQPYVVNWNNSLGQKTLLKALCIDSRNILYGPKWSYNMPKYAVNLSNAPLQPQKPSTSASAVQNDSLNPDKPGNKTDTWSDPFTSDGQEFTYAETLLLDLEHLMATLDQMAHNHSSLKISELLSQACNTDGGNENAAIEIGPTDLDVFEASPSSKPDKIFSSTINVQPMRQINLPDTHIFTPTNSETPRSKKIHYDSSSAGLFPQTVMKTSKKQSDISTPQSSGPDLENDNEYWEFQDFKGTSDTLSPSTSNQQPSEISKSVAANTLQNPNVTYKTAVLQPVKVEPIMPTLNWPDPGEVKETFDDFSDFVVNSSWSNEKQDISPALVHQLENSKTESDKAATTKNKTATHERVSTNNSDSFDDEFDTFQSALPSNSTRESETPHLDNHVTKLPAHISLPSTSQKIAGFSNLDSTPFATRSNDNIVQNPMPFISNSLDNITNRVEHTVKVSPIQPSTSQLHTNVLQPTPASSATSHNQQKSAQILQPLSLESYSQINWPNPGIDLQDLSRFNPVETLHSLKSDLSTNSHSKMGSPVHNHKSSVNNQPSDDDIWGEFVSSKPKQQQALPKKSPAFVDDDEWTDFVSSPSVKPQNGLNTISLNVHTNLNIQKASNQSKFGAKSNKLPLDIPSLNYITPKSSAHKSYNDRHFQNL